MRRISSRVDVIRNGVKYRELAYELLPTVSAQTDAEIPMSMTGEFVHDGAVDYLNDLLQPVLIVDGVEHTVGKYVPGTVEQTESAYGVAMDRIEAYDQTLILQQTKTEDRHYIVSGTAYLTAINQLLLAAGIASVLADDSAEVLATDREDWDVGTSYLTIINTLLSEINFNPVWFDLAGICRLQRIVQPSADSIGVTYRDNAFSVLLPERTSQLDVYDAPNVFIAYLSNPEREVIIKSSVNDSPSSALSTIRRGRRIVAPVERLDNIASETALQDYVDNLKFASMLSTETITYYTGVNGHHALRDVVALHSAGYDAIITETGWSMALGAGKRMTHTGKRVVLL